MSLSLHAAHVKHDQGGPPGCTIAIAAETGQRSNNNAAIDLMTSPENLVDSLTTAGTLIDCQGVGEDHFRLATSFARSPISRRRSLVSSTRRLTASTMR